MRLAHDYVLPYRGYHMAGGLCRVRIYTRATRHEEAPPAVAVLSELPQNQNTSLTNLCEILSCEVSLDRGLPADTMFVEHYPRDENQRRARLEEEIDRVTFPTDISGHSGTAAGLPYALTRTGPVQRPSFGSPEWQPLDREELEAVIGLRFEWEPEPEPPPGYTARLEAARRRAEDEHRAREAVEEAALPEPPQILPAFGEGSDYLVVRRVGEPGQAGARELHTNVPRSVVHHSPTGFEVGYRGSGPADLALNALSALIPPGADGLPQVECYRGRCSHTAWVLHQHLKEQFLSGMDPEGETIPAEILREWLEAHTDEEAGT